MCYRRKAPCFRLSFEPDLLPIPVAAVAAYSAFLSALPSAAPFVGAAVVSAGIIISHEHGRLDTAQLKNGPELAADCSDKT